MPAPPHVISAALGELPKILDQLKALSRIPSVSALGFPPEAVAQCARAVAELLESIGLEHVELIEVDGAHPYVVADWLHAGQGRPTLLLYAHYDVQPPGRIERWKSPPFEPTERDGRLFGRGVVDDKAGLMALAGALSAWLTAEGRLPVNIKLLVEGEEETGSAHLADFLRTERDRLSADVIILTDTANLEAGLPSLTTSLRGLVNLDVRVKALDHPLHSGIWGGPVRDAASALSILLARLFGPDGEVAVPGFEDDRPALSAEMATALKALPFNRDQFRQDAGLVPSARLYDDDAGSAYERLWLRPALAITALEAMPLAEAANQLIDEAAARVGIRLAPGQDPDRMRDRVDDWLKRDPPYGVEVKVTCEAAAAGWQRPSSGPEMEAARRALALGYGRDAVCIGCGGSIPFVGPFSQVLEGAPAVLLGLEDPICNAHGENESLHLGDFRSALLAATHLLEELANYPAP
ncbi:MAG: M20/M25/M40 family metallo-hydrolase [Myxococcota bacterium]|nr:M20/M25/M40 family metallo-hydrolase [Myxococcota bacterium]